MRCPTREPRGSRFQKTQLRAKGRTSAVHHQRTSSMNAVTIAQSAAVVATAARPRVTVSRANRAVRVPLGRSDVARVPCSSAARRRAVCGADKSDAEKTVSALDAILAGSQDEAAPEEVRSPCHHSRARGPAFSPPHHTPIPPHPLARRAASFHRLISTNRVRRRRIDRFADPSTPLAPRRSPPPPPPLLSVSPARCLTR